MLICDPRAPRWWFQPLSMVITISHILVQDISGMIQLSSIACSEPSGFAKDTTYSQETDWICPRLYSYDTSCSVALKAPTKTCRRLCPNGNGTRVQWSIHRHLKGLRTVLSVVLPHHTTSWQIHRKKRVTDRDLRLRTQLEIIWAFPLQNKPVHSPKVSVYIVQ